MPTRRAVPVRDLTEREVDLIAASTIMEGTPYNLADVPDEAAGDDAADRGYVTN